MKRRQFGVAALALGVLPGCATIKPEQRVRLGMSSKEVEALAGPVKNMSWIYPSPDKSQMVIIMFDGMTVREARRLKLANDGKTAPWSKEEAAQSYVGLPAPGTSSASVVRLMGAPPRSAIDYVAYPLFGEFEDDKLVRWETTPPPPVG